MIFKANFIRTHPVKLQCRYISSFTIKFFHHPDVNFGTIRGRERGGIESRALRESDAKFWPLISPQPEDVARSCWYLNRTEFQGLYIDWWRLESRKMMYKKVSGYGSGYGLYVTRFEKVAYHHRKLIYREGWNAQVLERSNGCRMVGQLALNDLLR